MAKLGGELLQPRRVEVSGIVVTKKPGEWVCVGKHQAREWIDEGAAWIPNSEPIGEMPTDAGVLFLGGCRGNAHTLIEYYGEGGIEWEEGNVPRLPWSHTLIWDTSFGLRLGLIPNGFGLLRRWQLAVPLWKYNELALRFGNDEERERTKEIIHDLRVMVYDPRCLFVKRCTDTEKLIEMWAADWDQGSNELAFLRALYLTKPLICALPISWGGKGER